MDTGVSLLPLAHLAFPPPPQPCRWEAGLFIPGGPQQGGARGFPEANRSKEVCTPESQGNMPTAHASQVRGATTRLPKQLSNWDRLDYPAF